MTLPTTAIAVLLGGPSAEHDVSLVSGRAIATALAEAGHDVTGWLLTLDGVWWRLPQSALDPSLPLQAFRDPVALGADGPHTASAALEAMAGADPAPVVFPALHGPFGEDGQVQSLLESAGLVYCGAGPALGRGDGTRARRRPHRGPRRAASLRLRIRRSTAHRQARSPGLQHRYHHRA